MFLVLERECNLASSLFDVFTILLYLVQQAFYHLAVVAIFAFFDKVFKLLETIDYDFKLNWCDSNLLEQQEARLAREKRYRETDVVEEV